MRAIMGEERKFFGEGERKATPADRSRRNRLALDQGSRFPRLLGGLLFSLALCCGVDARDATGGGPERPVYAEDVPRERLPLPTRDFYERPCESDVDGHVTQCGRVLLPLSDENDELIELAVARVFSNAEDVLKDPIVYLEGGPGMSSLGDIDWLHEILSAISPDRDFIFVDQRGTGESFPALECSDVGGLEGCFSTWSDRTDLDAFQTRNSAADIDAVRQAFGYEQWNLLGISYGARLALTVMRDFPEGVRTAILDSPVPLEVDLLGEAGRNAYGSILAVIEACQAEQQCHAAYPDIETDLDEVIAELDASPKPLGVRILDGDAFVQGILSALYAPSAISLVPQAISRAADGDFEAYQNLTAELQERKIAMGMHLSFHCSEEISFTSEAQFAEFDRSVPERLRGGLTASRYLEHCQSWPVARAPSFANEPVTSDIPTLVLSGEFDPITPPRFGELVTEQLSEATQVTLKHESHAVTLGRCGGQISRNFLENGDISETPECANALLKLAFSPQGGKTRRPRWSHPWKFRVIPASPSDWRTARDEIISRRR